ncbi:beta-galactosidase [Nocardioides sp. DS6]|uniref:Beta-galactosidase n=1 Tax=Nocardioides eburneus TaxID=3231482 RepID=A0ABV3T2F3_9ACTN
MAAVTAALGGRLAFGADYNPEQWPEEVWAEDVALMREAGVTMVSLGIFSWALLEPEPGRFDLGWLDRVLTLLHEGGIAVDLATATASPPPWFLQAHPEAALVDRAGVRRAFGSRQAYCASSPAFREAATRLAGVMAQRYADHPAVVMWHVSNEYADHNWHCYCDVSAAAFRDWLQARYGTLDALNAAWATAFWSQRYTAWEQLQPPREVSYNSFANPGQQLDWWRFSSDAQLDLFRAEAAAVRSHSDKPLTTNFMGFFKPLDYRSWAADHGIDDYVVSNDHYLIAAEPDRTQHLAMTADLLRSLAGGRPWLLMEHSTSAVNWQPRNLAKSPGEMRRNSFQHLARGADGAMFFQWRASRGGAEKFHSAMVPHAGTDSRLWRDVVRLGEDVAAIAEVAGTRVEPASVALLFDWPSWWAATHDSHPSVDVDPLRTARAWHHVCWSRNIGVDVVGTTDPLDGYRVVVLPVQYLLDDPTVARLRAFAEAGGTLVVTYFSGIVDEHDQVRLGGYPGALRDLLGVRIEEFHPLLEGEHVALTRTGEGRIWSELGRTTGAEAWATYAVGPCAGSPAITRHAVGEGTAWYVGTELTAESLAELAEEVLADVEPVTAGLPEGVEAVRRVGEQASYLFVVNHTHEAVILPVDGVDLLNGNDGAPHLVKAGDVAVIRES